MGQGSQVHTLLQDLPAQPYSFVGGFQPAGRPGLFAVACNFCNGGEPSFSTAEPGRNRNVLLRKQAHQQLLYCITVIVTDHF